MEKRVQGSLTWEFSEVQVALTGFKKLRLNRQHLHRHQTIVAVRAVGGCVELVSMCCLWKRSASDSASFSYHRLDLVWKTLEVAVRFLWKRWGAHWGKQVLNRDVPSAGQTNPPSHWSLADRCCLLGLSRLLSTCSRTVFNIITFLFLFWYLSETHSVFEFSLAASNTLSFLHSSVHHDITVGTKVGTSASSSSSSVWFLALFAAVSSLSVWIDGDAAIWNSAELSPLIVVEVAPLSVCWMPKAQQ